MSMGVTTEPRALLWLAAISVVNRREARLDLCPVRFTKPAFGGWSVDMAGD
ncbi:MAG: hypothetical protein IPM13_16825 [Phycisphaerales bacterium]|nr:hypothetical protein [Phycisphaerales bacterium]